MLDGNFDVVATGMTLTPYAPTGPSPCDAPHIVVPLNIVEGVNYQLEFYNSSVIRMLKSNFHVSENASTLGEYVVTNVVQYNGITYQVDLGISIHGTAMDCSGVLKNIHCGVGV